MKIIAEETVVRYHVELDEIETNLFKKTGFLPPHAGPRARLWWTAREMDVAKEMIELAEEKLP